MIPFFKPIAKFYIRFNGCIFITANGWSNTRQGRNDMFW